MTEARDHRFGENFRQGWAFREQDRQNFWNFAQQESLADTLIYLRLDTPWAGYSPKLIRVIFIVNHFGIY